MNAKSGSSEAESVGQFFHILHAVEQQRGCCELDGGKYEITLYTSCCNADRGIYYYTTYGNHQITAVDMHRENLDGDRLVRYPLVQGRTNCAAKLILHPKREKSACNVRQTMLYCTVHETFHVTTAWIEIEGVLI